MKAFQHKLRLGDLLRVQVVETMNANEFIVSLQGTLLRVRNESLKSFKLNEKILVRVTGLEPLSLQPVSIEEQRRGATRINVMV